LRNIVLVLLLFVILITQSACSSNDPGPLKGTWKIDNPIMPMICQFRAGETEMMGIIEKVSYKVDGNSVIVTSKDGIAKGTSMRYRLVDKDTFSNGIGLMQRVKQ
jgi:hypothetical protein